MVPLDMKESNTEKRKSTNKEKLQHERDVKVLFTGAGVEAAVFRRTRNVVEDVTEILEALESYKSTASLELQTPCSC